MEYADIFNGLFCNVASASILLPVQEKIQDYFSNKFNLKNSTIDNQIAIPLAIGYYYNMLDKIEDLLKGDNLVLKEHVFVERDELMKRINPLVGDNNQSLLMNELSTLKIQETKLLGRYEYSQINLKVIYPKKLTNRNLRECSFYLNEQTRRATLESITAGRTYGINFIPDNEEITSITIVDYARPIEVIYKYFNEFKGFTDLESKDDKCEQKIEEEMQLFLSTIKFLIEEKSSFLYRITSTEGV